MHKYAWYLCKQLQCFYFEYYVPKHLKNKTISHYIPFTFLSHLPFRRVKLMDCCQQLHQHLQFSWIPFRESIQSIVLWKNIYQTFVETGLIMFIRHRITAFFLLKIKGFKLHIPCNMFGFWLLVFFKVCYIFLTKTKGDIKGCHKAAYLASTTTSQYWIESTVLKYW